MRHRALALAAVALVATDMSARAQTAPVTTSAITTPTATAARAIASGDYTQALSLLTNALEDKTLTSDRRAAVLTDRGVVYTRLGNSRAAIADFNRAAQLYPESPAIYNNRGVTLLGLGFVDEAVKDFDRAILLAPGYLSALSNRASAYVRLGRPGDAITDLTSAIRLAGAIGGDAGLVTARAVVYLAERRPLAAMRDLDFALGADSRLAEAYRQRARARISLNETAQALEDLSRAIAFEGQNSEAYRLRGQAYLLSRNPAAAIKDFTSVIELTPNDVNGYLERGHAYILIDAFREAEADLARALSIDPASATAYAYRAMMLKKMGQAELGAVEVDKAQKLAPENAVVFWARGEIEEAMGRPDMALKSYEAAIARNPELKMARFGVERVDGQGAVRTEMPALGGHGWKVFHTRAGYIATSSAYPKLTVPLEMAGAGEPRILGFDERDGSLKGIGVLRYYSGTRSGEEGGESEYAVVLDNRLDSVAAIVPMRDGKRTSEWHWNENGAKIEATDGLTTTLVLRDAERERAAVVAAAQASQRRETQRRYSSEESPSWVPWASGGQSYGSSSQRGNRRSNPRPPRTIFDMLLGN